MRDHYPLVNELCDVPVSTDRETIEMHGWHTLRLRIASGRFPLSSSHRMEFEFADGTRKEDE
jgi:hypothetical protein